ncbi:MAG: hypothetical protein ACRC9X_02670 [Bacteroidales bacterium]
MGLKKGRYDNSQKLNGKLKQLRQKNAPEYRLNNLKNKTVGQ